MEAFWGGIGAVLLYFIVMASAALISRVLVKIPDELFRKILHCILLGSLIPFVFCFPVWWAAALTAVGFAVAVYPLLAFFEKFKGFSRLTTERKHGELKQSLLLVLGMFAAVIAICWGLVGDRWLVLASVYAWGLGDAAAALIGKKFGKHKIHWKLADSHKSYEGTFAMFAVSFFSVLVILLLRGGLGWLPMIAVSAITAAVSALAELCSKDGTDTVICPLCAMCVMLPMLQLFGGLV